MARIVTGAFTTFNLSTHLDPMTADLYDLRELISSPSYTASSPQVTIDGSGNFGFGGAGTLGARIEAISSTAPYIACRSTGVNPVQVYMQASSPASVAAVGTLNNYGLSFGTNSIERGRFDTSGVFLVGTQTAATQNPGIAVSPSGQINVGNAAQASGWAFAQFLRSSVGIGSITQSGTTAVLYNTTSDRRLKKNIKYAPDAGSIIDSIKVRSFDWRGADEHVSHGFIAQELHPVAPQAVKVGTNKKTDPWAVDPSKLVALLVKEVQSLRARVAALEGK